MLMRHQNSEYRLPRHFLNTDITIAAINETRISPPNGDANFDSNMIIILAAVLCALICALSLNSIVRCALRCNGRLVLQTTAEGVSLHLASPGLPKDALRRIPVVVYKPGIDIPATDCPICLGEFTEGEKVRILPRCNHGFHVKCIDAWLVSHSSCPNCRQILFAHPTTTETS